MSDWLGKSQRNERLLANADFRDFLSDVAARAGFISGTAGLTDDSAARCSALRELVMGVATNAANGGEFLKELAERTYSRRLKRQTEDKHKNGEDRR